MDQILCKSGKMYDRDPAMKRQALKEENVSRTQVFEWKCPDSLRPKNMRQVKSKVKSMLIVFLDITNNTSWHARQSYSHITVVFFRDCIKMCENFTPNYG
jgi:hypothetical protein